jgi:hypothetical protein
VEPLVIQGTLPVLTTPKIIWYNQTEQYFNITTMTPFKQIDDGDLNKVIQEVDLMQWTQWFQTTEFYIIISLLGMIVGIFFTYKCMNKEIRHNVQRHAETDSIDGWTVQFRPKPLAIVPPGVC